MGKTLTNQNFTNEEIKSSSNSRNISYHLVRQLLSIHLLSKNININPINYTTIILNIVLYGDKTLSLILKEEHWQRVFENRILKNTVGLQHEEINRS